MQYKLRINSNSGIENENSLRRATLVSALKDVQEYPGIQSGKAQRNVGIKALYKTHVSEGEKSCNDLETGSQLLE